MPQPFNAAVMTNAGAALLTKAQAGQCKIQFTKMSAGNGIYSESEKTLAQLQTRTTLKSQKNDYSISDIFVESDKSVKLKAVISNQDPVTGKAVVTSGYYVNEIGLYAKDTNGKEILYSIAVTDGTNGDFLPPYNGLNPAQIVQNFHATVDNSTSTEIKCAGAALLAEDANKITDDTTKKRYKLGIDNGNLYYEEVND